MRHGVTEWHREGRLLGHRDIGLNADGINQSHATAKALRGIHVAEVISSPLMRAVQSAEIVAGQFDIEVARDPRLTDVRPGIWEGKSWDEIAASEEYKKYLNDPLTQRIPGGGDSLLEVKTRAVSSIEQALSDSTSGDNIVIVSHAAVLRLLLSHYLGMNVANYHRLSVAPASLSILRFASDRELPRVLGINLHQDASVVAALR